MAGAARREVIRRARRTVALPSSLRIDGLFATSYPSSFLTCDDTVTRPEFA